MLANESIFGRIVIVWECVLANESIFWKDILEIVFDHGKTVNPACRLLGKKCKSELWWVSFC